MANTAPKRYVQTVPTASVGVWQGTLTAAEITAGKIIVPLKTGFQIVAHAAFMRGHTGTCSGPTTINFQESTTGGVVLSHVSADLTDGVWRLSTAGDGTVVTTKLAIPLVVSEGITCIAVGGSANTAMVTMDYIVMGFYVPATGKHT
jgi:hypothetical protein